MNIFYSDGVSVVDDVGGAYDVDARHTSYDNDARRIKYTAHDNHAYDIGH